jgi:LysR family transcriptional activator of nhaA
LEDLRAHRLDLILSDAPHLRIDETEIESRLVGKIPVVFCASPGLAKKHRQLPRDLDGAPLILPTSHSRIYREVQEYLLENHVRPRIVGEIQDIEVVRRLVLSGAGIAPLNQYTIEQTPGKNPLVILDKNSKRRIYENIYLIQKKRKRPHPLVPVLAEKFKLSVMRSA